MAGLTPAGDSEMHARGDDRVDGIARIEQAGSLSIGRQLSPRISFVKRAIEES